jgi:predicted CoA-binding protein
VVDGVNAVAPEDRELRILLGEAHTIAVVGLSSKPDRPSLSVAATASCR